MTSILMFLLNKGNQMVVAGDTQHTYQYSTKEEAKLEVFGELLFCASGYDRIIWWIYQEINNLRSITSSSKKILKLIIEKKEEFSRIGRPSGFTADDIDSCEFMIINSKTLKSGIISNGLTNGTKNIELIGSGNPHIGEVQQMLGKVYEFPFGPHLFKTIVEIFSFLGRSDAFTGHPAIFGLEIYLLEKNKPSKKFKISFKPDITDYDNYEVKSEDA